MRSMDECRGHESDDGTLSGEKLTPHLPVATAVAAAECAGRWVFQPSRLNFLVVQDPPEKVPLQHA